MVVTERASAIPASSKRRDSDPLEDHALLLSRYPITFTLPRLDWWNNSPGIKNGLGTAGRSQRHRYGLRCEVSGVEAQVTTGGRRECRGGCNGRLWPPQPTRFPSSPRGSLRPWARPALASGGGARAGAGSHVPWQPPGWGRRGRPGWLGLWLGEVPGWWRWRLFPRTGSSTAWTTAHRVRELRGKSCGWMLPGPPQLRQRSCGRALRRGPRAALRFGTLAAPWGARGTRSRTSLSGLGSRGRCVRPAEAGLGVWGGGSRLEPAVPRAAASAVPSPGPGGARPGPSSPGSRGRPCLRPHDAFATWAERSVLERAEVGFLFSLSCFSTFSSNQLLEVWVFFFPAYSYNVQDREKALFTR